MNKKYFLIVFFLYLGVSDPKTDTPCETNDIKTVEMNHNPKYDKPGGTGRNQNEQIFNISLIFRYSSFSGAHYQIWSFIYLICCCFRKEFTITGTFRHKSRSQSSICNQHWTSKHLQHPLIFTMCKKVKKLCKNQESGIIYYQVQKESLPYLQVTETFSSLIMSNNTFVGAGKFKVSHSRCRVFRHKHLPDWLEIDKRAHQEL